MSDDTITAARRHARDARSGLRSMESYLKRAQKETDPHRVGVLLSAAADHARWAAGDAEDAAETVARVHAKAAARPNTETGSGS